jgi:cell fate regulator YaaT (PSP1 superfamily)
MCCLTFENETYKALKEKFPKIGVTVTSPTGVGKVIRHNVICSRVGIRLEGGLEVETSLNEIIDEK